MRRWCEDCFHNTRSVNAIGRLDFMRPPFFLAPLFLAVFLPQTLHSQMDSCSYRAVPVSVLAPGGTPVTGLRSADFKASLRGAPVQIMSFEPYTKPARIVLVIDASSSMSTDPQIWSLYLQMAIICSRMCRTALPWGWRSSPVTLRVLCHRH